MTENELFTMFENLKNTTGREDKKELLFDYLDNEVFLKTVYFLYDNLIVTNLSSKNIKKNISIEPEIQLNSYSDFLNYLSTNVSSKDSSIKSIQNYLDTQSDLQVKEFLIDMATKNIKVGLTSKTINAVLKKKNKPLIFEFHVMLANNYKEKIQKLLKKNPEFLDWFTITLKLDGFRCVAFKENSKIILFYRSGKKYSDVVDIVSELKKECYPEGFVFDGELIAENPDNVNSEKLYRKTKTILSSNNIKKGVIFNIFDSLPISEFKQGKSKLKYKERRKFLETLPDSEHIKILKTLYQGSDVHKIVEIGELILNKGYEGIMINTDDYYYKKRVNTLLKYKPFYSNDGLIVDMYEGKNKNKNKLGGLVMTYHDILVNIGSGFSEYEREYFWNNKEEIIGKVGEYLYTEQTFDSKGNLDLKFSRWKQLRLDKSEQDLSYDN